MQKASNNNNGCLQFFMLGVLSVVSFVVIFILFPFSIRIAFIFAILISVFILKLILGNTTLKSLFRSGISLYFLFFGIYLLFRFLLNNANLFNTEKITFKEDEISKKEFLITNNDTTVLYTSHRNWIDNYGNKFSGKLSVREKDYKRLKGHIRTYRATKKNNFWGHLYNYMDIKDTPSLDLVMKTFIEISQEKKLNQMEFAEMVVSCIQDIPYSFVLSKDCPIDNFDETQRVILENCPECCIGNIAYGIQNSVSFIKNLKGDCDTRTVLIYSILKYFNYDVAILNSDYYLHSVIGLNIPASGKYKLYNGKKYMLWETTSKYYKIGDLPSNFNNVKHWNIVLTSK